MLPCRAPGLISMLTNAKGMKACTVLACASAIAAFIDAIAWLKLGWAHFVVVASTEAAVTEAGLTCFLTIKALNTLYNDNPEAASCPFDAAHNGFVMSEGASGHLVTTRRVARYCGLPILARIRGWANVSDAFHETQPDPEGMSRAIAGAVAQAGLHPSDIDLISAHGTSTELNDKTETAAYKLALGKKAYSIPVISIKGSIGHALGASGGIAVNMAIESMRSGLITPTKNFHTPAEGCDLDYVPKLRRKEINTVLVSAFGFGGSSTALVLQSDAA